MQARSERYLRGTKQLRRVDGEAGLQVVESLAKSFPDFATYVWSQASAGRTPLEAEISISTDSFRVRRLMALWVEEGALQPV